MVAIIEDYFRSVTTGNGINGRQVSLRRAADDVEIATATTANDVDGNAGYFSFDLDDVGYPGPVYYMVDDGTGQYKRHSGRSSGQVGRLWLNNLFDVLGDFGVGVTTGLAVSASGGSMDISVAAGHALLKDCIPYIQEAAETLTIPAAHATLARIDRIILRVQRVGQSDVGEITLMVLQGTPAGSPAAPALTKTSATWDISLAQVLVDAAATVISSGKVTDERNNSSLTQGVVTYPVRSEVMSVNGNNSTSAIARVLKAPVSPNTQPTWAIINLSELNDVAETSPSNGNALVWNGSAWAPAPVTLTVVVQEGDVTIDAAVGTLDFDASDFNITSSPSGEANVSLAYGNSAGTPAEGNHVHNLPNTLRARPTFAASGTLSSGSRDLYNDSPITLSNGVDYDIEVNAAFTARNNVNSGTFTVSLTVDGTTSTTRTMQTVGGVPRECTWTTFKNQVSGTGAAIGVKLTVAHDSGDATDFREGWVFIRAIPRRVLSIS